jgi:DNA polymerase theta
LFLYYISKRKNEKEKKKKSFLFFSVSFSVNVESLARCDFINGNFPNMTSSSSTSYPITHLSTLPPPVMTSNSSKNAFKRPAFRAPRNNSTANESSDLHVASSVALNAAATSIAAVTEHNASANASSNVSKRARLESATSVHRHHVVEPSIEQSVIWSTFGSERMMHSARSAFALQWPRIKSLFQWQIDLMMDQRIKVGSKNLVYSLPTSAGKTLIAQLFLLRTCIVRQCKALLVLPYRAVVDEVYQSLSAMGALLGVHVEAFYAARGAVPLAHGPMVCVATIERATGIISSLVEEDRLGELGSVVVDEIHFVGEPDRGCGLELLIARIVHHNKRVTTTVADTSTVSTVETAVRSRIQLIGFTATLSRPSLEAVAKWIDASLADNRPVQRPVQLLEYISVPADLAAGAKRPDELVYDAGGTRVVRRVPRMPHQSTVFYNNDRFRAKVDRVAPLVIETANAGGGTLVFVPTKDGCIEVACHLASVLDKNGALLASKGSAARQLLLQRLVAASDIAPHDHDTNADGSAFVAPSVAPFIEFVLHGIGMHNSDLSQEQRAAIEQAFLDGTVHTLVATTTLAAGVNLPARRVIVLSRKIGGKELEPSRFRQMTGRAGRAGFDVTGDAYLIADGFGEDIDSCFKLVSKPLEETRSQLRDDNCGVERLLLGALALLHGTAPRATLIEALQAALVSQMPRRGESDRQLVHRTLRVLAGREMVLLSARGAACADNAADDVLAALDDDIVTITVLGKACERVGYDPKFAEMIFDDCLRHVETLRMVDLLHLCVIVVPPDWRHDLSTTEWRKYGAVLTEVRRRHTQIGSGRRGGGTLAPSRNNDSRGTNGARDDATTRIEALSNVQALWNDDLLLRLGVNADYVEHRSVSTERSLRVDAPVVLTRHASAMRFFGAVVLREVLAENSSVVIAQNFLDSARAAPAVDELVQKAAAFGARLHVFLSHFTEFTLLASLLGPFVARLVHGGASVDLHPLVAIKGVGLQRARALFDHKVRTANQVAELTAEQLRDMLGARLGPADLRLPTARMLIEAAKAHVERERIRANTTSTTAVVGSGDAVAGGGGWHLRARRSRAECSV